MSPLNHALERTSDALSEATHRIDSLAVEIADANRSAIESKLLIDELTKALKRAVALMGYDDPDLLAVIHKAEALK